MVVEPGVTVIEAVVAPVFQRYVPPAAKPVAVIVTDEPAQIVASVIVTVGIGFTVTVPELAILEHPFKV